MRRQFCLLLIVAFCRVHWRLCPPHRNRKCAVADQGLFSQTGTRVVACSLSFSGCLQIAAGCRFISDSNTIGRDEPIPKFESTSNFVEIWRKYFAPDYITRAKTAQSFAHARGGGGDVALIRVCARAEPAGLLEKLLTLCPNRCCLSSSVGSSHTSFEVYTRTHTQTQTHAHQILVFESISFDVFTSEVLLFVVFF